MRSLIILLLVVLPGCSEHPFQTVMNARTPLAEVPATFPAWYAEVEECLGLEGDFDAVGWYWVSEMLDPRDQGAFVAPHMIILIPQAISSRLVVKHEMVHHILNLHGITAHWEHNHWGFLECAGG